MHIQVYYLNFAADNNFTTQSHSMALVLYLSNYQSQTTFPPPQVLMEHSHKHEVPTEVPTDHQHVHLVSKL
jgi:hypothetical protein